MKNSIEIIDIIDVKLMQLSRSQAVTTPEHKSYFQGMIDSLIQLRDTLALDVRQHTDQIAVIIEKM